MPPPSVYMTVSRSGQTWRPNGVKSSPVLPITVISASGTAARSPRRNLAAPTPPARTVMRMLAVLHHARGDTPRRPPEAHRLTLVLSALGAGSVPWRARSPEILAGLSPHPRATGSPLSRISLDA